MSWQLLTFISVIALSFSVVLQRVLLHKDKADPFAYTIVFQISVGILMFIGTLFTGFSLDGIEQVWWPVVISTILFGVGHIISAKALRKVEASTFSVLYATQAIWTMVLGIVLLGETMTALQVAGTLLIFSSVVMISKKLRGIQLDRGTLLGLFAALLVGVAIYYWSYVGRFVDGLSWGAVSFVATGIFVALIRPTALHKTKAFLKPNALMRMSALAVTYGTGSLTMLYAYKAGTFALVTPLRQTSIILTVFFALWFLKGERNNIGRKIAAACVCMAGVVLIVL